MKVRAWFVYRMMDDGDLWTDSFPTEEEAREQLKTEGYLNANDVWGPWEEVFEISKYPLIVDEEDAL